MQTDVSKIKKIAIFGGSFDPVHIQHEKIIKHLSKNFDSVIVMPALISPFKTDAKAENPTHRINMLNLIVNSAKLKNVTVSDYETSKTEVSYTYITVNHIIKQLTQKLGKDNFKLYFAIGTDMIDGLNKWKGISQLKQNITFYCFKRQGFAFNAEKADELTKSGISLINSNVSCKDYSSSAVKMMLAFNNHEYLSNDVYNYIKQHNLYNKYDSIVNAYNEFSLKPSRVQHTMRAVLKGIELSKIYNTDIEKTILALLYHDIAKNCTFEFLEKKGIVITNDIKSMPKAIQHAPLSAMVAKKCFNVTDHEVLDAIRFHTTGTPNMSELAKVVAIADAIEDGRSYDGLSKIKSAAKKSLDKAMEVYLKGIIEFNGSDDVYIDTVNAYEFYKNKNKNHNKNKEQKSANVEKEIKEKKVTAKATTTKTATTKKATTTKVAASKAATTKKTSAKKAAAGAVKKEALKKTPVKKAVKESKPAKVSQSVNAEHSLAITIAELLDDKKGRDIIIIDLGGKTIVADYFVVCSVSSATAVKALTEHVDEKLSKDYRIEPLRRDTDARWSAIDYGSVIMHIQTDETREVYDLERLWSDGTNIEKLR